MVVGGGVVVVVVGVETAGTVHRCAVAVEHPVMTTAVPGVAPLPCGARHRFAFWLRIVPSVRTDHRCDVDVVLQAARTTAVLLPDPPPAVSRHRPAGVRIDPSDQRLNCWGRRRRPGRRCSP